MKRRDFIKTGALGAVGAPILLNGEEKIKLKLATSWPANYPILQTSVEQFAKRVGEVSNGRIEIKVYAANTLLPALGVFDAASSGQIDAFHSATYYWAGKNSAFSVVAGAPFRMIDSEMQSWLYFGGGMDIWREVCAKYNLYPLVGGNTGLQMGGWFKKEIKSLEDIKGLKMRIPGLGGDILKKLGANTVLLAGGEIYGALERNMIDATEWVGPALDLNMGFHKIAKYYYTGWHEPASNTEIVFNKKVWDALSAQDRALIEVCANEMNAKMVAEFALKNSENLEQINNLGVQIKTFPQDVIDAAKKELKEIVEENSKSNPDFAKAWKSQEEFFAKISKWTKFGIESYLSIR